METELAALAASAATTIVNLLATDSWEQVKERIGKLWRRFRPEQADSVVAALDSEYLEIKNADQSVILAIKRDWESRLLRLTAADAAVKDELRRVIADLQKIPEGNQGLGTAWQKAKASNHGTIIQVGRDFTVGGLPEFCSHGNSAGFKCQVCMSQICWECDVLEWQNRYRQTFDGSKSCITVPTENFGYLRKSGSRQEEWVISDNQIVRASLPTNRVIEPYAKHRQSADYRAIC